MPSRRRLGIALLGTILTAALVAAPLDVTVKGWTLQLAEHAAAAKDGKGGGNGGKGGGGGGKGSGNGGGAGKGGGNSAGSGKSGGSKGKSGAAGGGPGQHYNPRTGDSIQVDRGGIEVLHRNGMREKVSAGKYEMKDSKGRTIIQRRATAGDLERLRNML